MRTKISIGLISLILTGTAFAESFSIQFNASFFSPSDKYFKSIYGNAPMYGLKIGATITKGLVFWVDADFYTKNGRMTQTTEVTNLKLVPILAGLYLRLIPAGKFSPYLGGGIGYFLYQEKSPLGTVSKGDVGFVAQAGIVFKVGRTVFADLQGSYTACKVNPAGVEADLGGLKAGLGLGFAF